MFSVMCVCVCSYRGGVSCDNYPWCIGLHHPQDMEPHCTGTPLTLPPSPPPQTGHLTVQEHSSLGPRHLGYGTPPHPLTQPFWTCSTLFNLDLQVQGPLVVTSGGQDWISVQTCSLKDPPSWCWHLVATEVFTVGKWTVRILLVCFLVSVYLYLMTRRY